MVSVSAQTQHLQLHCDEPGCRRKFIPKKFVGNPRVDRPELFQRARRRGWVCNPDRCPQHKEAR